jgi:hypothetical protein
METTVATRSRQSPTLTSRRRQAERCMGKLGLSLVQLVVVVAMGSATTDGASIDRKDRDTDPTTFAPSVPATR